MRRRKEEEVGMKYLVYLADVGVQVIIFSG
jgi:hypothetical protein